MKAVKRRTQWRAYRRDVFDDTGVTLSGRSASHYAGDARALRRRYFKGSDVEFQRTWYQPKLAYAERLLCSRSGREGGEAVEYEGADLDNVDGLLGRGGQEDKGISGVGLFSTPYEIAALCSLDRGASWSADSPGRTRTVDELGSFFDRAGLRRDVVIERRTFRLRPSGKGGGR